MLVTREETASKASETNEPKSTGEYCPRCGSEMEWVHSSMHCPGCHFKPGCCGGW